MSKNLRTTIPNRPRTKIYDTNYSIGENYYKSALDSIDRKYNRSVSSSEANDALGSLGTLRASLERERERQPEPRPRPPIEEFEEDLPRRKTNTLLNEFDSIFEGRRTGNQKERTARTLQAVEDEFEEDVAASLKRAKAAQLARRAAAEEATESLEQSLLARKKEARSKLDFSEKLIDSLHDEGHKKTLKVVSKEDGADPEDLTRWTALARRPNALEDLADGAAARARQSRARLEDLEAEMQALTERGAAREKRIRDLRSLLSENEATSKETLQSTLRVKSTIQSEKKVVSF